MERKDFDKAAEGLHLKKDFADAAFRLENRFFDAISETDPDARILNVREALQAAIDADPMSVEGN